MAWIKRRGGGGGKMVVVVWVGKLRRLLFWFGVKLCAVLLTLLILAQIVCLYFAIVTEHRLMEGAVGMSTTSMPPPKSESRKPEGDVISDQELKRLEARFLSIFEESKKPPKWRSSGGSKLFEGGGGSVFHTRDDLHLKSQFGGSATSDSANTVRTFTPTSNVTFILLPTSGKAPSLHFDITIPPQERLIGAELRVPFSLTPHPSNATILSRILLHDVVKNSSTSVISYATDSKLVHLTKRRRSRFFLTFDVLPAISRWTSSSTSGGTLALELLTVNGQPLSSLQEAQQFHLRVSSTPKRAAVLFIYADDGNSSKIRRKRATVLGPLGVVRRRSFTSSSISRSSPYQPSNQYFYQPRHHPHHRRRKLHRLSNRRRNLCSRKPMFVDFTDVGWNDWIVAPPGYQAYYCSGECPFPMGEHLNATNHAVIQALINSMSPGLVPSPCCVPKQYSSLSLLYTDSSDRIVLKNYNDMIVHSCGCA